jgi:pyridinium-3,5-bisthiocarboxylic acid mononucleotide nickel chelatase
MKTLYLDIFSGISGDMFIGAILDLGVSPHRLARELEKLKLDGFHLHVAQAEKSGIAGIKFDVHLEADHDHKHGAGYDHEHEKHSHAPRTTHHDHDHGHEPHPEHGDHDNSRNFRDIKKLITKSKLSPWVKKKSIAVFQRIADAEGKIHGKPASEVHFHEVGAVDSIVDIVGACIGLELLGKPRVLAGPVVEGTGWIRCAHGRFPIPAPATLAILGARKIPITQCDEPNELVTPTGAALLAEFVERFEPMTGIVAEKIGFGLGTRDNQTRPNVLRAVLGDVCRVTSDGKRPRANLTSPVTRHASPLDWETDRVAVLETNLDDISSEILGAFVEAALAAGALDVFHTPIQMKKNRPGVLLTVLCAEADADKFSELILRETTAFGVRRTIVERRKLRRELTTVKTKFGPVTVKLGKLNGKVVQAAPEFESCRKLARQKQVTLGEIYRAAVVGLKK